MVVQTKQEYVVFVDESFHEFMTLSSLDGWFCYGALMVPKLKLGALDRFFQTFQNHLLTAYKDETGHDVEGEFKSNFWGKLPVDVRKRFAEKLVYFCQKNGAYLSGFYTNVAALLRWHLRSEVAPEGPYPASDPCREIDRIRRALLSQKKASPGDSALLSSLLRTVASISFYWLARQGCSFAIQYDPRQRKEDRFLLNDLHSLIPTIEKIDFPGQNYFLGARSDTSSEKSSGLMLVDFIAREIRLLFQDLPVILSESSSIHLLIPQPSKDGAMVFDRQGVPFVWGYQRAMESETRELLNRPTINSIYPLLFDVTTDKTLACYTADGIARRVNCRDGTFDDMID